MYDPAKPHKNHIFELIKQTWKTPYATVQEGTYPLVKSNISGWEVDHTDGIGTKGLYHWQSGTFKEAVQDALAMNLNDLALVLATPYKVQNHLTLPREDRKSITAIITALVEECRHRDIAITGGETSFQNTGNGMDLSITMTGFVERPKTNRFRVGDVLIGLPSNGLHSNGFSKVREIFGDAVKPDFTRATAIYLDEVLQLSKKVDIRGMMHITGGAFTKLKDLLEGADAYIRRDHGLSPQAIFKQLHKKGVGDKEMYITFNCGIGFVLGVAPRDVEKTLSVTKGEVIGVVRTGSGKVLVDSMFSHTKVKL